MCVLLCAEPITITPEVLLLAVHTNITFTLTIMQLAYADMSIPLSLPAIVSRPGEHQNSHIVVPPNTGAVTVTLFGAAIGNGEVVFGAVNSTDFNVNGAPLRNSTVQVTVFGKPLCPQVFVCVSLFVVSFFVRRAQVPSSSARRRCRWWSTLHKLSPSHSLLLQPQMSTSRSTRHRVCLSAQTAAASCTCLRGKQLANLS